MRKTATLLSVLGLVAVFVAAPAWAINLMSDNFTYSDGNLAIAPNVSGGNWLNHSGSGPTAVDIQVVSGTAQGNMVNAPDDNRTFAAQSLSAKTYACFTVKIPAQATTLAGPNYFAHFKDTGTSNFPGRVYVMPLGTTFTFGVSLSSANALSFVIPWTAALNFDQTYHVVVDYDAAAGTADLWVDPLNELSPKVTSNTSSSAITPIAVSAFALRQSSAQISTNPATGVPNWKYVVDDLGVGTTFTDACNGVVAVQQSNWTDMKSLYR